LALTFLFSSALQLFSDAPARIIVHSEPLHEGRISPKLFGNFVELLDDVVPSLWAELLNDRAFAGVTPCLKPFYYDGAPNFCDREWDTNSSCSIPSEPRPSGSVPESPNNLFHGLRSAKLSPTNFQSASLTQSGLALKSGMTYLCSGWFRGDRKLQASIVLKTLSPTGDWIILGRTDLPPSSPIWQKHSVEIASRGQTDRAVFELRVEGDGTLWATKLSCMPADNLRGWRRDVVEAIKELRPSILRWGGSVCDPGEYRWKNGIGDRDFRTPFRNKVWGRIDSNDVGIDEFCQLCELTGAEPLICVSFSDGSQSAADLVEYCNGSPQTTWGSKRADNGHPAPYHVKYWQVGNEISGDDPKYLAEFGAFSQLMKKADSKVLLMSSYPSEKLLAAFGNEIAYVCPHHYTRNFDECGREFTRIGQMLKRIPGCEKIRIAVTEWNETGGEWGLQRGRQMTLQNALHNARYLNLLMRRSDGVEIACRSSIANSFCGGVLQISPSGLLKRPGYYALQLYARHAQPVPLRVDQSASSLDIAACSSEDKTSGVIFAVNFKSEPVECSFGFAGFSRTVRLTKAHTLGDTLDARQPEIMNHWSNPDRIKITSLTLAANRVTLPALSVTAVEWEMP
ncbi:MAG TPA: alpha-L-arabinofuranosidase C-terminal domain-containing protein, partial [Verrucomicrobiae bacterium]|nr:alpha-L-arabinofuranosidase C-terminal domain-containing protein [Verrucomicrobiae bacterium]